MENKALQGRLIHRAPLISLLTANAISMVGNVLALIAIPWFVLQSTGSPAKTGITGFFMTLAAVVAAFFGGAIVDRLGFKRTSITADVSSGIAIGLIPLLYATIGLQYWQLLILVFAGNFLDAPGTTAREAIIPELAELGGVSLERASASIQAVERGSRMVGAPLAGALIAIIGTRNVLWLDAASFGISALIVTFLIPALKLHSQSTGKQSDYVYQLKEGIRFIVRDQLLLAFVALVLLVNFLDAPAYGVLYPVYIQQFYGNALDLGLLVSFGGAGSLAGAVIFGAVGHKLSRRAVFFAGFILIPLHYWAYALVPSFWIVLLVAFIAGLGAGPINPILSTIQYERIPPALRGRVLGTVTSVAYIAIPLGVLIGGYSLEWINVRLVLAVIGTLYFVTILAAYFNPAFKDMDAKKSIEIEPGMPADVDY
ncbi:MAG: MFS transporter [Anaerolineaceae bacterium]|nr:MFS transporter [Anaerolineaceae bacterium]